MTNYHPNPYHSTDEGDIAYRIQNIADCAHRIEALAPARHTPYNEMTAWERNTRAIIYVTVDEITRVAHRQLAAYREDDFDTVRHSALLMRRAANVLQRYFNDNGGRGVELMVMTRVNQLARSSFLAMMDYSRARRAAGANA